MLCAEGTGSTLLLLPIPCFSPKSSEVAVGFLVFLHFLVHNLPRLCMHVVIFSPLYLLCILLLKEMFVQVQTPQQRVPGPSLLRTSPSICLQKAHSLVEDIALRGGWNFQNSPSMQQVDNRY